MTSLLASLTSLPNLHPAVVHFPIALVLVALGARLVQLVRPERRTVRLFALWATVLAGLGGGAAWYAGHEAAEHLEPLGVEAEEDLGRHADLGETTGLLLLGAALLAVWLDRRAGGSAGAARLSAWGGAVVLAVAAGFTLVTADLGGGLVYGHGVAVAGGGGTDAPADTTAAAGGLPSALALAAPGRILLPADHGDVTVDARIDRADHDGPVVLLLHAPSDSTWEGLRLTADGRAELVRREAGAERVLAEASVDAPTAVRLQASAAAGHFKGFVDGAQVVHGHLDEPLTGPVGLAVGGTGQVVVVGLSAAAGRGGHDH